MLPSIEARLLKPIIDKLKGISIRSYIVVRAELAEILISSKSASEHISSGQTQGERLFKGVPLSIKL